MTELSELLRPGGGGFTEALISSQTLHYTSGGAWGSGQSGNVTGIWTPVANQATAVMQGGSYGSGDSAAYWLRTRLYGDDGVNFWRSLASGAIPNQYHAFQLYEFDPDQIESWQEFNMTPPGNVTISAVDVSKTMLFVTGAILSGYPSNQIPWGVQGCVRLSSPTNVVAQSFYGNRTRLRVTVVEFK